LFGFWLQILRCFSFNGENTNLDKFTIFSDIVTWISLCVCYFQMLTSDESLAKWSVDRFSSYIYWFRICIIGRFVMVGSLGFTWKWNELNGVANSELIGAFSLSMSLSAGGYQAVYKQVFCIQGWTRLCKCFGSRAESSMIFARCSSQTKLSDSLLFAVFHPLLWIHCSPLDWWWIMVWLNHLL
jgi:hypothetical protein